jgi:hypothetical protein
MMGYRAPNIDRIANDGAIFTEARPAGRLHGRLINLKTCL